MMLVVKIEGILSMHPKYADICLTTRHLEEKCSDL